MTPESITHLVRQTFLIALEIAAPFLLFVLIIGLAISIVQSIAHIQEMTLSFVPKILALGVALFLFFPWVIKMLTRFSNNLLIHQWDKVTALIDYVL